MKNEGKIVAALAILLIALVVIAVLGARMTPNVPELNGNVGGASQPPKPVPEAPVQPVENPNGGVTQAACGDAGGSWNECASACRGADPNSPCILMCVQECECLSNDQCPAGTTCQEYVDTVGVCKP